MINAGAVLLFAHFLQISDASAGTDAQADSVSAWGARDSAAYMLPEVVVTATRTNTSMFAAPSQVSVLSAASLAVRPGSLLLDALQGLPGVVIRSYGGPGAVHTLSLRGMSPEHTLVLVDGHRINNPQNGQVDFALLPSSALRKVEIVRGGFSGLYGSDAVGGVIDLQTKTPPEAPELAADAGFGSAGFRSLDLSAGGSVNAFSWILGAHREYGRGDYAFEFSDGKSATHLTRTGADYGLTALDGSLRWEHPAGASASASLLVHDANRGSPGAMTDPLVKGTARLADAVQRLLVRGEMPTGASLRVSLAGSYLRVRQQYADPGILVGGSPLQSDSETGLFMISPAVTYVPSERLTIQAGGDIGRASVTGSDLRDARRAEHAAYVSGSVLMPAPWGGVQDIALYPSLRFDEVSDVGSAFSPRLGVNVGLLAAPLIRLRASAGRSFRVPSFNDLYWRAGGNPNLRPERSTSADAGIVVVLPLAGQLAIDVGAYTITARDRILWVPGPGGLWSPRNVGTVLSQGMELDVRWSLFESRLRLGGRSSWSDATKRSEDYPGDMSIGKRLLYVPPQTVSVEAEAEMGAVSFYLGHLWVSHRYTTEVNDRVLPPYGTTSAAVRWDMKGDPISFHVKGELTNLFNVSYQVIALYPMPLRGFRIHLGAAF